MRNDLESLELDIKIGILDLQQNGFDLFLMSYCAVFGVELDKIKSPSLGEEIISEIQKLLSVNGDDEALAATLEAVKGLIENSKSNFQTIFDYKSMLLSKQRSLTSRNTYGDKDESKWIDFASKFAIDKLHGYSSLKSFVELYATPLQRRQLVQTGLIDMFGLYTRQMLTLILHFTEDENRTPTTGEEYEEVLREQIKNHFPTAHVETTPKSGDHGVDLIADINNTRIAIQAKYYTSSVGNAAVQEAHAGKGFCGADHAMVVCDTEFTRHAIELADKLGVYLETTQSYLKKIEMLVSQH